MLFLMLASVTLHVCCFALVSATRPTVDLDYAVYGGVYDSTFDQIIFRGIRYAAPPTGKLRWQLPQAPEVNRSQVIEAIEDPPRCPQSLPAPGYETNKFWIQCFLHVSAKLLTWTRPANLNFTETVLGDEDCLFLNVFAPANATDLPVLLWIHGGGYGRGKAEYEFTAPIQTNNNSYIAVVIQYRLGAFGFLSSADVAEFGTLNAAIHDMRFALKWVQTYIHLFGGDASRVTIAGKSAGGGSVMLLSMAYGGTEGTSLFNGVIADSPYLATQWEYDGDWPSETYRRFAEQVGCLNDDGSSDGSRVFECLQSADTIVLQNASNIVSNSVLYQQWGFIPVTDSTLVQRRPIDQLLDGQGGVNGIRILSGVNLNEGPSFVPQNITSESAMISLLKANYPRLTSENITSILDVYAVPDNFTGPRINSDGMNSPYATTTSNYAIGWQQTANNLYAETTFVCPAYWLAEAFAGKDGGTAWLYQFSPPPALHAEDVPVAVDPPDTAGTGINEVFRTAFQRVWGNFIVNGYPTLSAAQVGTGHGPGNNSISAAGAGAWPAWGKTDGYQLLNMNMTGGIPVTTPTVLDRKTINITSYVPGDDSSDPPLKAVFNVADAMSWEDGRGDRCQLVSSAIILT